MSTVAQGKRGIEEVVPRARHVTLGQRLGRVLIYVNLAAGAVILLFPLYWLVSTGLKPTEEVSAFPIIWIPSRLAWENYATLFQTVPFWGYLQNSLFVTLSSMV